MRVPVNTGRQLLLEGGRVHVPLRPTVFVPLRRGRRTDLIKAVNDSGPAATECIILPEIDFSRETLLECLQGGLPAHTCPKNTHLPTGGDCRHERPMRAECWNERPIGFWASICRSTRWISERERHSKRPRTVQSFDDRGAERKCSL